MNLFWVSKLNDRISRRVMRKIFHLKIIFFKKCTRIFRNVFLFYNIFCFFYRLLVMTCDQNWWMKRISKIYYLLDISMIWISRIIVRVTNWVRNSFLFWYFGFFNHICSSNHFQSYGKSKSLCFCYFIIYSFYCFF